MELIGFFKLANELKNISFDKVFIFNSSARFNLIAKLLVLKKYFNILLFEKQNQHIVKTAQRFIKKN